MVKIVKDIWELIPPNDSCPKSTTIVTKEWTDSHIQNFRWPSPKTSKKIENLNIYLQFLTKFLNCKWAEADAAAAAAKAAEDAAAAAAKAAADAAAAKAAAEEEAAAAEALAMEQAAAAKAARMADGNSDSAGLLIDKIERLFGRLEPLVLT